MFLNITFAQEPGIVESLNQIIPGGLGNILSFGIGVGGAIALGVMIYAGILYSMSGDNSSKQKEAKEWIFSAVKGLAVLTFGYLLIVMINPMLTTVEEVNIPIIDLPSPEVSEQPEGTYIAPGTTTIYSSVPLLKQGGGDWGDDKYGNGCGNATYATSACGPTAIAMTVLYLTGNRYMDTSNAVKTIGDAVVAKGLRPCGHGTSHVAVGFIADKYDLRSESVSGRSDMVSCFQKGGAMISVMRAITDSEESALRNTDPHLTPIFTKGGHFITVTGIDEDRGLVFVNDPGGRNVTSSKIDHFLKYETASWCVSK